MPFITDLNNTENTRAVGEFKGLVLASTVWYDIFEAGFHFCDTYTYFMQIRRIETMDLRMKIPAAQPLGQACFPNK